MIVKNEMDNLARCLASVVDYISCWVIGDTGSTDGTQDFLQSFFGARAIPGELHSFPFHDFEQARNEALSRAFATPLVYDYLLLADADMELVVEDVEFRDKLREPGYRLIQRSGLTYWNTRIVRRDPGVRYFGVTHEYLDVPGGVEELRGAWFRDHASGANRVDKFERDIRLLTGAIEKDPENRRYWFYLAQSQRDAGRPAEAAVTYAKRADMGGWEEEAWQARLEEARCLLAAKDEDGFLRQALSAYNQRPQRAEPLYSLARFFREREMYHASVLFSEAGLELPSPVGDILFVEDFVYTTGLFEEFAIAANYAPDADRKKRGHAACEYLALSPDVTQVARDLARWNLSFYVNPAHTLMASFQAQIIDYAPPVGYRTAAPSVTRIGEQLAVVLHTVSESPDSDASDGTQQAAQAKEHSFLLHLNADLTIEKVSGILWPCDTAAQPPPGKKFEDVRVFELRDDLWCTFATREHTDQRTSDQVLARLATREDGKYGLADLRVLGQAQANDGYWLPRVEQGELSFVTSRDSAQVADEADRPASRNISPFMTDTFRGGSQAIQYDGGWLALVYEVRGAPDQARYTHRFVQFDSSLSLIKVSHSFFFLDQTTGFAAGLTWHPDGRRLVLSFGGPGHQTWIATVDASDVRCLLHRLDELRQMVLPSVSDNASPAPWAAQSVDNLLPDTPALTFPVAGSVNEVDVEAGRIKRDIGSTSEVASELGDFESVQEFYDEFAPFLHAVDAPAERRVQSRAFDMRIGLPLRASDTASLPIIHSFYEVLSEKGNHQSLVAAVASMRAAGHHVRLWTFTREKLEFLLPHGAELCDASEVIPKGLFDQIVADAEVRYFSDVFRYAVLYEHGGLWMDCDVILLRPFPYHGDYFFNLQWRGAHVGHFICGNVIHAVKFSRHMRCLYEISLERFFSSSGRAFGDIGPKLLSDYIASPAGAELRSGVFSPMLFNSIDWSELDRFDQPIAKLRDYLCDDRVFGVHLWHNRTAQKADGAEASLLALLSDPVDSFPALDKLADQFSTDRNRVTGNRHFYTRIYSQIFAPLRLSVMSLIEIGPFRSAAQEIESEAQSISLWRAFFPFCHMIGVNLGVPHVGDERFTAFVCDQANAEQVRAVSDEIEPASIDLIIDDGSHASRDQQMTFRHFFPLLRPGGRYIIEDLDWQPTAEGPETTSTKDLFRQIQHHKAVRTSDPFGIAEFEAEIADIAFFDSQTELERRRLLGGLVVISKRYHTAVREP